MVQYAYKTNIFPVRRFPMATMLFTLLLLCSSAFGAIYQRFEDLLTRNFDFIIIGGMFFCLRYTLSDL